MTRTIFAAWLVISLAAPPIYGQSELGTVMKKHYKLRSISCNSCHIKGADEEAEKSKDKLTPFGHVILRLAAGQQITERLNAVQDKEEEQEQVKGAIKTEFAETVKKLDVLKDPSGKTYAELIQAGEIDGIRPRK